MSDSSSDTTLEHPGAIREHRPVPLVVQLGFAGSRMLIDSAGASQSDPAAFDAAAFDAAVQAYLTQCLERLPTDLGLKEEHFLCGISQVAVGADTLFTRACGERGIPQRVFLPQHRDEYLSAVGSDGTPDFTDAQRRVADELLDSDHVVQIHVVSLAHDRQGRFEQANIEIARASDVVICLIRAEATAKPGGSGDMLQQAAKRNLPVLEIRVGVRDGAPTFTEKWHRLDKLDHKFALPKLPTELGSPTLDSSGASGGLPDVAVYCTALKSLASHTAMRRRKVFTAAALAVIGFHVLATLLAVIALAAHGFACLQAVVPWLVGLELPCLAIGFGVHQSLHHSRSCETWAVTRVVAELARSVGAAGSMHVYLSYLFELPFPVELRPLLRTINVLHLRTTRPTAKTPWETVRDAYVATRLTAQWAQISYYKQNRDRAKRALNRAGATFVWFTVFAFTATVFKFPLTLGKGLPVLENHKEVATAVLGAMTIFFPVVAVAALSLAAAFDVEARFHTYKQMHDFLTEQSKRLIAATSRHEFAGLLLETESHLLGETANWYARRSFTGVA